MGIRSLDPSVAVRGVPVMRLHAAAILVLGSALAACASAPGAGQRVADSIEDLCLRRDNPVYGREAIRELARIGADCTPYEEPFRSGGRLAAASPEPPSLGAPVAALPSPPSPPDFGEAGAAVSFPRLSDSPAEAEWTPGAPASVLPPTAQPAVAPTATAIAPEPTGNAPFAEPACAERLLRRGPDAGGATAEAGTADANHRAVSFRNRCDFPIRVLFASRPDGSMSEVTDLLGPGEAAGFVRIQDGFDQPGYVVCSYQSAPESAPCRLTPAGG